MDSLWTLFKKNKSNKTGVIATGSVILKQFMHDFNTF